MTFRVHRGVSDTSELIQVVLSDRAYSAGDAVLKEIELAERNEAEVYEMEQEVRAERRDDGRVEEADRRASEVDDSVKLASGVYVALRRAETQEEDKELAD